MLTKCLIAFVIATGLFDVAAMKPHYSAPGSAFARSAVLAAMSTVLVADKDALGSAGEG